jgi:hypothetical protein
MAKARPRRSRLSSSLEVRRGSSRRDGSIRSNLHPRASVAGNARYC